LQLSTRAANCLRLAQVETVGDLVNLTSADILRWPRAGDKTLRELRALLRAVGLSLADEPAHQDAVLLGKLEGGDLSAGAARCVRTAGIRTVADLAALKSADVLRWHHAGETTLSEIRAFLRRLGLSLADGDPALGQGGQLSLPFPAVDQLPAASGPRLTQSIESSELPTRATNCLRRAQVKTLGDLVALSSQDVLAWDYSGKATLADIRAYLRRIGLTLSDGDIAGSQTGAADLPRSAPSTVLEEELRGFASSGQTERNTELLVKLWGWNGQAPRTLDSVGREFGLTRERVRQIERRASSRLSKRQIGAPILRAALAELESLVPDVESALGIALRDRGICKTDFGSGSLQTAAQHLNVRWPFEYAVVGSRRILVLAGEGQKYREMVSLLRKRTSERGCVSLLSLASYLGLGEERLPGLRRTLEELAKIVWLDDFREWLYSSETSRNRLFNLCSKVLGVAPRLHLSELRRAVSRSRRLAMCPPQRVLGAFVERRGLGTIDGSTVNAKPGSASSPADNTIEGCLLRVLDECGPVIDGEVFADKCVARGMNATTFYLYRMNSPLVCALGKNVYSKVGASVPPGAAEEIVARRRVVARSSDHGWTRTGLLWSGIELTRQVVTAGGGASPSSGSRLGRRRVARGAPRWLGLWRGDLSKAVHLEPQEAFCSLGSRAR
jgi:DNA-directed RNA polymerase alpha subunit